MNIKSIESYMPLTTSTYYILLTLINPLHGYGIAQYVDKISSGKVKLSYGTLYGTLSRLEKENIIKQMPNNRTTSRKLYQLTEIGRKLLELEFNRLHKIVNISVPLIQNMLKDCEPILG